MIKFLDLQTQFHHIHDEINTAISSVIEEAAFIGGKYVKAFENNFAAYCGASHCVSCGNGTDALELCLSSLELPPGSEIMVPANSFIASSEAVTMSGHQVRFCDCNADNFTIDIADLKKKITDKTRGIIAVHIYGHPCDMDALNEICKEHDLKLIEDCAQAHGAEYRGRKVGTFGHAAAFSFYPGKNLGAYGDGGGAVVTNDDELARKCRMLANHGRETKYNHTFEGRNSRLDGIQAAILDVKLKHLEEWTQARIAAAGIYREALQKTTQAVPQVKESWARHVYHLFVIRVPQRDKLREKLTAQGIDTGIHYPIALPNLDAYKHLRDESGELFAKSSAGELLSLPIGEHLDKEDILTVTSAIEEFYH